MRPNAHPLRLAVATIALLAFVLVPFALWGEQLDRQVVEGLQRLPSHYGAIAAIGITLLVIDVLLPVPSSAVAVFVCFALGPVGGAVTVFIGMVLAFAAGYGLGALVPAPRLRAWIGQPIWDSLVDAGTGFGPGLVWIGATRPIPVLAEAAAVAAGSLRLSLFPSLLAAAIASAAVAAAYGFATAASTGLASESIAAGVVVAGLLPATCWGLARLYLRRPRSIESTRTEPATSTERRPR